MCKVIKDFFKIITIFILFGNNCFGQDVTVQQNQQNVNINLPVIEKTVYVDRYRTVYVDKPLPKRVAKKLSAPIQLLGYLWIYTEDIGNFKQPPYDVIKNINVQNPYGRNNWRIPTPDELAVMENNADDVGLGDDIYLATDHSNGVLRLVSTGKSVAEQNAEIKEAEQKRILEEAKKLEEMEKNRLEEEAKMKEEIEKKRLFEEQKKLDEQKQKENENYKKIYGVTKDIANEIKSKYGLEILVRYNISYNNRNYAPSGYRLITYNEMITIQQYLTVIKKTTYLNSSSRARIPTSNVHKKYRSGKAYVQPAEITLCYNTFSKQFESSIITTGYAGSFVSYDDGYKNALNENLFTCIYVKLK